MIESQQGDKRAYREQILIQSRKMKESSAEEATFEVGLKKT